MSRVVVIDESAAMRRLLRFMLKEHEIIEARFGFEAIQLLDQGPFELVLCDTMLADMPASEFYERLVEDGYSGPVLFIGSGFEPAPRDRLGGRLPFIRKPIDAELLVTSVEGLLVSESQRWDVK